MNEKAAIVTAAIMVTFVAGICISAATRRLSPFVAAIISMPICGLIVAFTYERIVLPAEAAKPANKCQDGYVYLHVNGNRPVCIRGYYP